MPHPGEIWSIRRDLMDLVPGSNLLDLHPFSPPARRFLDGDGPVRYVMIVGDARRLPDYARLLDPESVNVSKEHAPTHQDNDPVSAFIELMDQAWVTVMVLGQGDFGTRQPSETLMPLPQSELSHADVVLPAHISGLNQDVIAETWHIMPMLMSQLLQSAGKRLPSQLYHELMDRGDAVLGETNYSSPSPDAAASPASNTAPSTPLSNSMSIINSGPGNPWRIKTGLHSLDHPQVQRFHQSEKQWSEILRVPMTACYMQFEELARTESILNKATELERYLFSLFEDDEPN